MRSANSARDLFRCEHRNALTEAHRQVVIHQACSEVVDTVQNWILVSA